MAGEEIRTQENRGPRWEDITQNVCILFLNKDSFVKFAESIDGLALDAIDVQNAMENNGTVEAMKRSVLLLWQQRHRNHQPQDLLNLAKSFLGNTNKEPGDPQEPATNDEKPCFCIRFRTVFHQFWQSRIHVYNLLSNIACHVVVIFAAVLIAWCFFGQHNKPSSVADGVDCYDSAKSVKSFKSKVNEATNKFANDLQFKEMGQPGFDIFPETVVVNFYNSPVARQGYVPELDFTQQVSKMAGNSITMADFFLETEARKMRYVALVGGVGYGKTEMLKRIARDALSGSNPALKDIEMVRLIYLRDLEYEGKMTVGDLLFADLHGLNQDEVNCGLDYIVKNPRKVLFVLDGLDQYPEKLGRGKPLRSMYVDETPNKILSSLLSGYLFPNVRVLLSSREHAIRHFEGSTRPERVVALSGFSLPSIENLVKKLGGTNDGERIWRHLQKRSPTLLSVSSIPMFLVFTVMVLKQPWESPPETSTEVLMHVLHYLETSNHATHNIIPVIAKLKEMSFNGTKAGEVSFTRNDLPSDLSIDEATDLLITLNGVGLRNQRLFDGHFRLNFCHQSLQEALTALYVSEMPVEKFRKFVIGEIHKPQWVIVRRMVCGLLLNPKTLEIAQGNDPSVSLLDSSHNFGRELEEKRKILRSSLKDQLVRLQGDGKQKSALLELMHALHQCGESVKDVIADYTDEINLLNMPLTKSDAHVLFSTINYCPKLTLLSLINCDFGDEDLLLLAETFKKSKPKVRILLLGNYEQDLSPKSAEAIRDMLKYVTDFAWLGYRIDEAIVQMFRAEMKRVNTPEKVHSWKQDTKRMVILEND